MRRSPTLHRGIFLGLGALWVTMAATPPAIAEPRQEPSTQVRELDPGTSAISPPRFPEWTETSQIRDFADQVRERTMTVDNAANWEVSYTFTTDDLAGVGDDGLVEYEILTTDSTGATRTTLDKQYLRARTRIEEPKPSTAYHA